MLGVRVSASYRAMDDCTLLRNAQSAHTDNAPLDMEPKMVFIDDDEKS